MLLFIAISSSRLSKSSSEHEFYQGLCEEFSAQSGKQLASFEYENLKMKSELWLKTRLSRISHRITWKNKFVFRSIKSTCQPVLSASGRAKLQKARKTRNLKIQSSENRGRFDRSRNGTVAKRLTRPRINYYCQTALRAPYDLYALIPAKPFSLGSSSPVGVCVIVMPEDRKVYRFRSSEVPALDKLYYCTDFDISLCYTALVLLV